MLRWVFLFYFVCLLPLISVRKISPLNAIRISYESGVGVKDPLRWIVYLLILGFIFCSRIFRSNYSNLSSSPFCFAGFLFLAAVAKFLMWSVKHFSQAVGPMFGGRVLPICIAQQPDFDPYHYDRLGNFVYCHALFCAVHLMDRIALSDRNNQANMVLFDIQSTQRKRLLQRRDTRPFCNRCPW